LVCVVTGKKNETSHKIALRVFPSLLQKDKISEEEKSMLKQQIEELSNKLLANSDITASNSESSSLVKIGADEATKSEEVDEGGKTPSEEDDVNVVEDGGDGWGSDDGWGDDL